MIKSEQQKRFSNLVGVDADGNSESPGQAEVGDLDGALAIDQQVLRLQVAVKNAALEKQFKVQRSVCRAQRSHSCFTTCSPGFNS